MSTLDALIYVSVFIIVAAVMVATIGQDDG